MKLLLLFSMVFLVGANSCSKIVIDEGMSAVEGGDYTALIQGCGSQLVVGYTYCRKREGDLTDESIILVAPKVKCKSEQCVSYKIFFPDGSPTIGGMFGKEETSKRILWSDNSPIGSYARPCYYYLFVLFEPRMFPTN